MEIRRIQFGRRANRRFNYIPRYYDEDKEDLENRVNNVRMEVSGNYDPKGFEQRIRDGFNKKSTAYQTPYNTINHGSRIRFLFILITLGLVFYLAFYTKAFGIIFGAFINA
ncbi:MAG: hypothetical protein GC181_00670 [Bacteroidetes bacterium]|nr:hypothetical protein [Bacteroidota bacterium]